MRRYKTYINGEWFEGTSGIVLRSVDPSNNKELGEIVQNSKEDVEYAIESASRSFTKPENGVILMFSNEATSF